MEDSGKFSYIYNSFYPSDKATCDSAKVKGYAGTEKCKSCHSENYKTWSKYYMSRFVKLRKDIHYIPNLPNRYSDKKSDVAVLVGGRQKVAVVIKPWEVVPYQYNKFGGKNSRNIGWKYRPEWESADYRSHCGRCHLTGLDIITLEFSDLGVGCEACHGPGKQHVDSSGKNSMYIPEGTIACAKCHFLKNKHMTKVRFSGTFHR